MQTLLLSSFPPSIWLVIRRAIMEQAVEREDPAQIEKKIESENSSIDNTHHNQVEPAADRVWCSEEEALARARSHPYDKRLIFITFGEGDPSNPRNYPLWKKWYITCFVSSLNVLTCLCAGGYSSGTDGFIATYGVSSEVGVVPLSLYILGKGSLSMAS